MRSIADLQASLLEKELQEASLLSAGAAKREEEAQWQRFLNSLQVDQVTFRACHVRAASAQASASNQLHATMANLFEKAWDSVEAMLESDFPARAPVFCARRVHCKNPRPLQESQRIG